MWTKCAWGLTLVALFGCQTACASVHKCLIQGAVHYQQAPCPSADVRRQPTVAELNQAQKRLQPHPKPAARPLPLDAAPVAPTLPYQVEGATSKGATMFRCDSRKRCPQMTSCAEAKFFLANCPTVEMDGDGDGIPCERQWCQP
jgi:Excalibur calcium-binding domain